MIADGNSVGVFAEVINDGLCTVKGFLTVWNPIFSHYFRGIVVFALPKESLIHPDIYLGIVSIKPLLEERILLHYHAIDF